MKNTIKILTLALIALLTLSSCSKSPFRQDYKVSFTGSLSPTFHCYINNKEVSPTTIYDVKKCDVLKVVDTGTDEKSPDEPIYQFQVPGGMVLVGYRPGPIKQGYTSGTMILLKNNEQIKTPSYSGYGDTNLTYTIQ